MEIKSDIFHGIEWEDYFNIIKIDKTFIPYAKCIKHKKFQLRNDRKEIDYISPFVQHLRIFPGINDDLPLLASKFSNLITLTIDQNILPIKIKCSKQLVAIKVIGTTDSCNIFQIDSIIARCKKLEKIEYYNGSLGKYAIKCMITQPITVLILENIDITDIYINIMSKFFKHTKNLQTLSTVNSPHIQNAFLKNNIKIESLMELSISISSYHKYQNIMKHKNLTKINVIFNTKILKCKNIVKLVYPRIYTILKKDKTCYFTALLQKQYNNFVNKTTYRHRHSKNALKFEYFN